MKVGRGLGGKSKTASTPRLRAPTALHAENPIRKYGGSVVLGLLGIQSIRDLILEVPKLGSDQADYFGTAIDVAFTAFVATQLATQSGVAQPNGGEPSADLAGLDFKITMSVGRESGTWMDKSWAASGARLLLPLQCSFTGDELDLGFPGEEALAGRYCRRLDCDGGSFVGPGGTVTVACDGGGWWAAPTGRPGEQSLRFFLDFPEGAERNDVSIPPGRVFFSSALLNGDADDAFLACFDVVSKALASFYADITKSLRHPNGGAASLHVLDADEPYLGGVSFHATPPSKRFCEISQLSGGERTLASLALLFAVHGYHPAPFMIMDEVDAALDNVNVAKLANFIKHQARGLQIIAVSLKDQFYTEADALVGVAKDAQRAASVPFTLDLGAYA